MEDLTPYYRALLSGFISGTLDKQKLSAFLDFVKYRPEEFAAIADDPEFAELVHRYAEIPGIEFSETLRERMRQKTISSIEHQPAKIISFKKWWWAAAAILVVLLGTSIFLFNNSKRKDETKTIAQTSDALPGGNKATLTLSNGSTIVLDSAHIGELANETGVHVSKTDSGNLTYTSTNEKPNTIVFNTLSTPRGGQYHLQLADGTQVWLNAASSIKYPTTFTGNERNVVVTGEAYFEVAKDRSKPFNVNINGVNVQVLGTHFDVNGYTDEPGIKTTLLEGSVLVSRDNEKLLIKPGEQAEVLKETPIRLNKNADVEEVMAWKNGRFQFNNTPLQEVLKQLSRWYDVDIEYDGNVGAKKVGGKMQRDLNLSEVLDGLKDIGVNFRIEGKKLIVKP